MAKAKYERKNGKIQLTMTQTATFDDEELFSRQQQLRDELRICRENIKRMQEREQEIVEELAELQTVLLDVTTAQVQVYKSTEKY